MAKYRVGWPVEATMYVIIEAESEGDAINRAFRGNEGEWERTDVDSYVEDGKMTVELLDK